MLEYLYGTPPRSESIALFDILEDMEGLSITPTGEFFSPTVNVQSATLDGKPYRFKPDPRRRLVKRIHMHLRYRYNSSALASAFIHHPSSVYVIGLTDVWNRNSGFLLFSDVHNVGISNVNYGQVTTKDIDLDLVKTLDTPLPQEDLLFHIGGRNNYTYEPVYISNFSFEYA